jgi:nicotinate-nucleotide pyrophosphorylase (carboxylating)
LIDKSIKIDLKKKEGSSVKKGETIGIINGNIKNILTGERVVLNFLSHISGIATTTNQFVKKVSKKCKICCTRKTIPNLRVIQKYAVKLGGGTNHRFNLSDEYLIKDNHIASLNIEQLVELAVRKKNGKIITVEVDNLNQLKKIIGLKFDRVLFDNMKPKILKKAVKLSKKFYETEASGGITIKNIKKIANTGVNRVSIGSLTHSFSSLDLKLEI